MGFPTLNEKSMAQQPQAGLRTLTRVNCELSPSDGDSGVRRRYIGIADYEIEARAMKEAT